MRSKVKENSSWVKKEEILLRRLYFYILHTGVIFFTLVEFFTHGCRKLNIKMGVDGGLESMQFFGSSSLPFCNLAKVR